VTEGTAKKAAIEGYSVAGKTGTVRKMGESGYEDTRHLAFFAGMAPVDHPRVVGVVLINEPKGEKSSGGAIAAPVFSRVIQNALRILNVPPAIQVEGGAA
jgi:cell division protein FtsI (penicillin-binding protein 3)